LPLPDADLSRRSLDSESPKIRLPKSSVVRASGKFDRLKPLRIIGNGCEPDRTVPRDCGLIALSIINYQLSIDSRHCPGSTR
jgi:hypothetical protein